MQTFDALKIIFETIKTNTMSLTFKEAKLMGLEKNVAIELAHIKKNFDTHEKIDLHMNKSGMIHMVVGKKPLAAKQKIAARIGGRRTHYYVHGRSTRKEILRGMSKRKLLAAAKEDRVEVPPGVTKEELERLIYANFNKEMAKIRKNMLKSLGVAVGVSAAVFVGVPLAGRAIMATPAYKEKKRRLKK